MKRSRVIVGVLLLLLVALCFSARPLAEWYAWSLATKLFADVLGTPVEIDRVTLTLSSIEVQGLRVPNEATSDAWMQADVLRPDLTPWQAITGQREFNRLEVQGARLLFEFDAAGNLLTRLPASKSGDTNIPCQVIEIRDASLEVRQSERTPAIVQDVRARVVNEGQQLRVESLNARFLESAWTTEAVLQLSSLRVDGRVRCQSLVLDSRTLASFPLAPEIPAGVQLQAETHLDCTFAASPDLVPEFLLVLEPQACAVQYAAASFSTPLSGQIELTPSELQVESLTGQMFGADGVVTGRIARDDDGVWRGRVTGSIDRYDLRQIDIQQLLPGWSALAHVEGRVNGECQLDVDGSWNGNGPSLELRGTASSSVDDFKVADISLEPMRLEGEMLVVRGAEEEWSVAGDARLRTSVHQLDLHTTSQQLQLPVPDLNGTLTGDLEVSLPLATLQDPGTYRASADLQIVDLRVDELNLGTIQGKAQLSNGQVTAEGWEARLPAGEQIRGDTHVAVFPPGPCQFQVDLPEISTEFFADYLPDELRAIHAALQGNIEGSVDWRRLTDPTVWSAAGTLVFPEVAWKEWSVQNSRLSFELERGRLRVPDLAATWKSIELAASGQCDLLGPLPFELQFALPRIPLDEAVSAVKVNLPVQLEGELGLDGTLRGEVLSRTWQGEGQGKLDQIGLDLGKVEAVAFSWRMDSSLLHIDALQAELWNGTLGLEAEIPLAEPLKGSAEVVATDLDPQPLLDMIPDLPVEVAGTLSGNCRVQGAADLADLECHGQVALPEVVLDDLRLADAETEFHWVKEELTAHATGSALGGQGSLQLSWRPLQEDSQPEGMVEFTGIQLAGLWSTLGLDRRLPGPLGSVAGAVTWKAKRDFTEPVGTGTLSVRNVNWQGFRLPSEVSAAVSLTGSQVRIGNVAFQMAGGRVTGSAEASLTKAGRGSYAVTIEGVDASRLLQLWPEIGRDFRTAVFARVRGQFSNQQLAAVGQFQLGSGTIHGIPVGSVRVPFDGSYDIATGTGRAGLKLTRASVSRGSVSGKLELTWGNQLNFDGKARLNNVELQPIARTLRLGSKDAGGRLSGDVELRGNHVNSLDDCSGSFRLKVAESQIFRLPIMQALPGSFLLASPSETFSDTKLTGHLHRGVVFVDQMTMKAATLRMFIEGRVTTRGQLDLDVTADTAELAAAGVLLGVLRPTDLLKRRLLFLHTGGTIRNPVVLPRTDKFVAQEVELFFLGFLIL